MLHLASRTSDAWADWAAARIDTILVDHAHCEKKAASTALGLLFRYPDVPELQRPLAALAREEVEHFERMLDVLDRRRIGLRHHPAGPYASELRKACRAHEPARLVDTLLCCGLIEARSCERMGILARALADEAPEVADLYRSLLASEARHHTLFVDLARKVAPNRDEVEDRLAHLAREEARILAQVPPTPHLHAGP